MRCHKFEAHSCSCLLRPNADDGRCAIDIVIAENAVADVTTGGELSRAAAFVLRQCVMGNMQQGGVAAGLGELEGLIDGSESALGSRNVQL